MVVVRPEDFAEAARKVLGRPVGNKKLSNKTEHLRFREFVGTSFEVYSDLWTRLDPEKRISKRAHPKHLLWALLFAKVYSTKTVHNKCKAISIYKTELL